MNLIGLHFKIRRAVLDFLDHPSKIDRDIECWFDALTPDKQEMVVSRLLIFSIGGLSGRGMQAYIKKMMVEGVTRDYPG